MSQQENGCDKCCYRNREVPFCGVCMKKIVLEMRAKKESEVKENGKEQHKQFNQNSNKTL